MPLLRASVSRTRALLVVLAVVSLVALFTTRVSRKMPDFQVYWTAASRALAAEPLYRADDGHYQFKYLPAFAVLASPIALAPLPAAKGLWFAASALLMIVLLGLSVLALPELRRPAPLLVVLTFVAMAKFYAHELVLGQVNLLFAVIVTLAIVWLRHGRDAAAGALLALAVVVKPYAAIFLPWAATRRNKKAFVTMAVTLIALLIVPALRYGWHGNLQLLIDWWRTVTGTTPENLTNPDNVSLSAMYARWLGSASAAALPSAITAALLLIVAAIVIAGRGMLTWPDALETSLLLLLIPLLSPQGWDYVCLIGTPAVMLLLNYSDPAALPRGLRFAALAAIAIVALSIYDVLGRDLYSSFMRLSVITICVVVEVAAIAALRFRRIA